jgi:hypothetical protein
MRVTVALVLVCAAVAIAPASATQSGGNPTPACNESEAHAALHRKTARKNWRDPKPLAGTNLCIPKRHVAKHMTGFRRWRAYRNVAPYRGFNEGDPYLKWLAVPAYIVACETNGYRGSGRWHAANASGAVGPAQLLGWGAPHPANTPQEKIRYWQITRYVLRVQGLSAWACA